MNAILADWKDTIQQWMDVPAQAEAFRLWRLKRKYFSARRRVLFYDKLHDFCGQGRRVSLREGLTEMRNRAAEDGDKFHIVLDEILDGLRAAPTATTLALKPYLPPSEFTMLFAADEAGKVAEGLANARDAARQVSEILGEIKGSLAGPLISLLMLMGVIYALPTLIVDVLVTLVPEDRWPTFSLPMLWLSKYVPVAGHWVLIGAVVIAWKVVRALPTWTGPLRNKLDHALVPWSFYRAYQSATTMIAISGLKRSGRGLRHALEAIVNEATPWLREHLDVMIFRLSSQGATVVQAMDTGLLGKELMRDLRDYAKADAETKALELLGTACVKELRARISMLSTILRFTTMVGLVLLFLYVNGAVYAVTISAQDYVQELQNGVP